MKKISLVILILLFGCMQENSKVKIIENYDSDYLTDEQVDSEPGDDTEFENMFSDLKKIVSGKAKEFDKPFRAYLSYRLYVNENGKVDGIKEMPIPEKYLVDEDDYIKIYSKDLLDKVASAATDWKFMPAMKNDKPVKFRGDIEVIINVDEDGKVTEEIPALNAMSKALSQLRFMNKDAYFVKVDEQPYPVGGMMAIQEKIKYPEEAKTKGLQGRVYVKAYINENGQVDDVALLKGFNPECDSVAMEAIRQTKFNPAKQNGVPVKVQVSIPIVFKLK